METVYTINKFVIVEPSQTGGYVCIGSRQKHIKDNILWNNIISVLYLFYEGRKISEVLALSKINDKNFYSIVSMLIENNFITPIREKNEAYARYDRNFIHYMSYGGDPIRIQENLLNAKVTIIGCGGIGNHVSAILAGAGVGEITLVDCDTIELSNLTRQYLFTENDIGNKKTTTLKRELLKRNSSLKINEIELSINSEDDFKQIPSSNIWVLSADEPLEIGAWLHSYCYKNNQAYIRGCYLNDISVYGPMFIPKISKNYSLNNYPNDINRDKRIKKINSNFKPATFPSITITAAACCAGDIIKYIGGYASPLSIDKRIGIWSDEILIKSIDME
ncbi:ThiF family adenylyltransferase [Aggregatibacter actinomycetemcomitans]|nr:ThiF family adenylyltransferase [Aggregatibacter actinomycetemcomitans]